MNGWLILYGYGTPSAFVYSRFEHKDDAEILLRNLRRTWREHADRFTLHDAESVVRSVKGSQIFLKKSVFKTPTTPQREPLKAEVL